MSDKRSEVYRAEAERLLEAAQKAKDYESRIGLIRMAAKFLELAGEPPIDVDALAAQASEQETQKGERDG